MKKSTIFPITVITAVFILALIPFLKPENHYENTLFQALQNGNTALAKDVINKIDNLNITDINGNTPLIIAAAKGYNNVAEILLSRGSNINHKNLEGHTALMEACENQQILTVPILLRYKPKIHSILDDGESSLAIAAGKKNPELLKLLLEYIDYSNTTSEYIINVHLAKAIDSAAYSGDIEALKIIFSSLGKHSISLSQAFTAMNTAEENGHPEIVEFIMDNSSKLNFLDRSAISALMVEIAKKNYPKLLKDLIDEKANVNYQNPSGLPPLIAAANNGMTENIRILLEAGADKTLRCQHNLTARDHAILNNHNEAAEMLK